MRDGDDCEARRPDAPALEYFEMDSAAMPPGTAFAAWSAAMPYFEVSTPDPASFAARGRAWAFFGIIVTESILSPIKLARTRELIAADRSDDITMQFIRAGRFDGEAEGRAFSASPGDIALQDLSRPFVGNGDSMHVMTVRMPHSFAGAAISDADIHGLVLERDRIPLLRAMLGALPEALANGRGSWAEVAALLRDHIAVALSDVAAAARQPAGLRVQARRFIETNLSEAIDARRVCAALGVSRSSIYRAFERDGGVTAFIQRRRLAHIHTLLSDPNEHRPIRDIAAKYGFVDRSHFSRLFRQTFGYTPGDLRMRKRAHAATVTLNDTARLGRRLVHWQ